MSRVVVPTSPATGSLSRVSYQVARAIAATITRLYTRMSIDGREHVPRTGGFVLAPVHRSYVDTPIACCVTRRRLRYMGKDSLWRNRAFGWLLSALGGFPVTRGTADREALRRCIEVLGMGEVLVLYPGGRAQGRADRATAVRRRRVCRRQSGRSDRARSASAAPIG